MDSNSENAGTQIIQRMREQLSEARRKDHKRGKVWMIGVAILWPPFAAMNLQFVSSGASILESTFSVLYSGICASVAAAWIYLVPTSTEERFLRTSITDDEMTVLAQLPENTRARLRERLAMNKKLTIGDVLDVDDGAPFIVGEGAKMLLGDHDAISREQ